jgi:hypothetical protein
MGSNIFQFKVAEASNSGFSGLLDVSFFSMPHFASFAVSLRGPYVSTKEFNLSQMFKDLYDCSTTAERIKLIHNYASHLYTYIASLCGYGDDGEGEMMTADVGMNLLSHQTNADLFSNPHVHACFCNVFDNLKSDMETYRAKYHELVEQAEQEKSQIIYYDDSDDDEEEETMVVVEDEIKKRKAADDDADNNKPTTKKLKTEDAVVAAEPSAEAAAAAKEGGEEEEEDEFKTI